MTVSPSPEQLSELEPCPHCGEADAFVERADYSSCYVICNNCMARGPTSCNVNDEDCAAEDAGMEPGENAARRLWNTRTTQAEIARLRNNCTYLLSCIDMSNEAGAPPDELDAEDQAEIAAIREGNQP